ncbi:MCP four helix bundle domain-containing protein [Methanospirillum sp. J.3.6.1-F.2.7.3]|uniref:MCP four helix bundle domain-containing protein n=1 Tax=Methanospirillum purgamenti TaxID=2834276 RepID=A0A8E7B1Y1_9EURY|nr:MULTISPECIES: methyl-accepting chemotaxis protein [Methanospirillum]MDX8549346.1 methyl-accepting chemotaxis protein [Methanospirillum hungatei]QVV89364.1 MCP four helix bundle domain-containing protein [Methanospirillum sp. J.3.6.1-F.2.7.3]
MIQLDDLTISKKLLILVIVGILAIIVVGCIGIFSTQQINGQLGELYQNKYAHSVLALEAYSDMMSFAVGGYMLTLEPDPVKKVAIQDANQLPYVASFKEKLAEYESIPMNEDETAVFTDLKQASTEYFDLAQQTNDLNFAGKVEESTKLRTEVLVPTRQKTYDGLAKLIELNTQSANQYYLDAEAGYQSIVLITVIITIICAIILLLISWLIIRNLTRRINMLITGMGEVGAGNLSHRIALTGKDEITQIGSSFDSMAVNLEKQSHEINRNIERSKQANTAIMNVANAIKSGNIDATINTSEHEGEFLVTVQSVNDLISAFVHPLQEAMNIVNKFAAGNFAARYDSKSQVKGDFEKFKNALDNSGMSVSGAINGVKKEVNTLSGVMEETNAGAEEVTSTITMLAQNSSSVSMLAERNSSSISQVLSAMDDLSKAVGAVASSAEEASEKAMHTVDLSKKGLNLAGKAETGMNGIMVSFEDTGNNIQDINNQMEEIGKIVDIITGISEQTGLLALNAAIEAARAGEAGMGFAVVADEVKSLALESQKSAENIATIIGNLQKKSQVVSDSMTESLSEVKSGNEAVRETLGVFNEIVQAINVIYEQLAEGASASEEQAAAVEEITASVHEIETLVQQTAKEAVDSAAATQEVTASIDQISRAISEATASVQRIAAEMGQFMVS